MMNEIIVIDKPLGITSFDVIRDLKKKYPRQKIGHAGTLDPLASGVLICLIGSEATRRQGEFMNIDKDYEFDVLFGIGTDTFDILGLINNQSEYNLDEVKQKVTQNLNYFKGKYLQKVPPFSAVKINGREIYRWYLDGRINEIQIPSKEIEVTDINILTIDEITKENLAKKVLDLVDTVKSGFRQKMVVDGWQQFFDATKQDRFLVVRIKATVSKGTYVRAIANDLCNKIGIPACTITIRRTRVGEYRISPNILVD